MAANPAVDFVGNAHHHRKQQQLKSDHTKAVQEGAPEGFQSGNHSQQAKIDMYRASIKRLEESIIDLKMKYEPMTPEEEAEILG